MRQRALLTIVIATGGLLLGSGCGDRAATPAPSAEPGAPLVSSHHGGELQWEEDWQRAVDRARSENKLLMVNFSADWCIWCKRYDATTFADSEVIQVLAQQVVPLRLIIDGNGRERARELRVQAPPTLVFLEPSAAETGRILGYMPPGRFLRELERILPQND